MSVRLFILALFVLEASASASEVLSALPESNQLQISQDKNLPWTENDRVCIFRQEKKIACGKVTDANAETATVSISERTTAVAQENKKDGKDESYIELIFGKAEVKRGDVAIADESQEKNEYVSEDSNTQITIDGLKSLQRQPASLDSFYEDGKEDLLTQIEMPDEDDERILHHDKISNFTFGLNYIFPTIQYQQAITKKFAMGLTGQSVSAPLSGGSLSGYGGMVTFNFYSLEAFHGTYIQMGGGIFSLTGTGTTGTVNLYAPNIIFNAGWRWFWESGLNFGFAAGVEYFLTSQASSAGINFSGLFPSIALDFGIAF